MNLDGLRVSVIFVALLGLMLWGANDAPDLGLDRVRSSTGVYGCDISPGRSPVGDERFNGRKAYSSFGYWFGYGSAGPCFKELDGAHVQVKYFDVRNDQAILVLEMKSIDGLRVYGLSFSENLERYHEDVAGKEYFWLQKFLMFIIISLLVYARDLFKFLGFSK